MFCIPIQHAAQLRHYPVAICLTQAFVVAWPLTADARRLCASIGTEVEQFDWLTVWNEPLSVRRAVSGWSVAVNGNEVMIDANPQFVAEVASFLTDTVPFVLCAPYELIANDAHHRIVWQHTFNIAHPLPTIAVGRATQTRCAAWEAMGWFVNLSVPLQPYGREGILYVRTGTDIEPAALDAPRGDIRFRTVTDLMRWATRT